VPLEGGARAFLDARSVSFSGGTVSLHDGRGIPLTGLGTGSSRLLVAGLQREAAPRAGIVLVDEVEHGLEPHRVIGLLGSLGAKEKEPPLQVFATTHSPVAVRELAAGQLNLLRKRADGTHWVIPVGNAADVQGTLRSFPEAFLAAKVVVCEGASEVGFLRGLDIHRTRSGLSESIAAQGVALVDAGGVTKLYGRADAFAVLSYPTMAFRDDDRQPSPEAEAAFLERDGKLVRWRTDRALEDELFASLPNAAVTALVKKAEEFHTLSTVKANIGSASPGSSGLQDPKTLLDGPGRAVLAKAAKQGSWFKTVSRMEEVAADIVGPHLAEAEQGFQEIVADLFDWMK